MVLNNKIALVTGGASGIGAEIAKKFVAEGAKVIIADIDSEAGTKTIQQVGENIYFHRMDIGNEEQVKEIIDKVVKDFLRIDILINNAGVTNDKLLLRMTKEDWDYVIGINLTGVFLVSKAVMISMIKQL